MEFDWRKAIDCNCEALCAIAARLILMAGLQAGHDVETLPRRLYRRVLALLRPAEYAARRLIVMAACTLELPFRMPPPKAATPSPAAKEKAVPAPEKPADAKPEPRVPAFQLFDPFKQHGDPFLDPGAPAGFDYDDLRYDLRFDLPPGEPVDARALGRRIRALAAALSDLEGQAQRLARWRTRRDAGRAWPKRWNPIRPGRPPGWVKKPKTGGAEVLKECHFLALDAWNSS